MCTRCNLRYKKCANCYWQDNCPLSEMTEDEISLMKRKGDVNPNDFADFDNCKHYYKDFCEYYTPFDDDELGIVEYERELKERADIYEEFIKEQNA